MDFSREKFLFLPHSSPPLGLASSNEVHLRRNIKRAREDTAYDEFTASGRAKLQQLSADCFARNKRLRVGSRFTPVDGRRHERYTRGGRKFANVKYNPSRAGRKIYTPSPGSRDGGAADDDDASTRDRIYFRRDDAHATRTIFGGRVVARHARHVTAGCNFKRLPPTRKFPTEPRPPVIRAGNGDARQTVRYVSGNCAQRAFASTVRLNSRVTKYLLRFRAPSRRSRRFYAAISREKTREKRSRAAHVYENLP